MSVRRPDTTHVGLSSFAVSRRVTNTRRDDVLRRAKLLDAPKYEMIHLGAPNASACAQLKDLIAAIAEATELTADVEQRPGRREDVCRQMQW